MPKPILPTLKERNRYIAFESISDSGFSRNDVVKAVWNSILNFFGEMGASRTSLWVMDWDEKKQKGILKANHRGVDTVRTSLALVEGINGHKVIFNVLGISGTIKKARERYLSQPSGPGFAFGSDSGLDTSKDGSYCTLNFNH